MSSPNELVEFEVTGTCRDVEAPLTGGELPVPTTPAPRCPWPTANPRWMGADLRKGRVSRPPCYGGVHLELCPPASARPSAPSSMS
jgi:hypothetical protein